MNEFQEELLNSSFFLFHKTREAMYTMYECWTIFSKKSFLKNKEQISKTCERHSTNYFFPGILNSGRVGQKVRRTNITQAG
jgi:hypothetical protein